MMVRPSADDDSNVLQADVFRRADCSLCPTIMDVGLFHQEELR